MLARGGGLELGIPRRRPSRATAPERAEPGLPGVLDRPTPEHVTICHKRCQASRRYASGRLRATPGRRESPAGSGPTLRRSRNPSGASSRRPGETRCRPLDALDLDRRPDPEQHRTPFPHEREAPLDGRHGLGERLRDRDAVALERLLLRSAPDDAQVREARPASARGTRTCGARPRGASPLGRAGTRGAGSPACRRPSRRRRSGPARRRRAGHLAARRRAGRVAPRTGRATPSGPGLRPRRRASAREGRSRRNLQMPDRRRTPVGLSPLRDGGSRRRTGSARRRRSSS